MTLPAQRSPRRPCRRRPVVHLQTGLLLVALSLGAPWARAETDTEAAVALAYEAKERFEAGDYQAAIDKFTRAKQAADSPVFDLFIARSLKALGRWVEASALYDRVAALDVDPTNTSWVQAQESARKEGADLEDTIPRLTLAAEVQAPPPRVELDGKRVPWPAENLAVDPGRHVVSAHWQGRTFDDVFVARPDSHEHITLTFEAAPSDTQGGAGSLQGQDGGSGVSPWVWTSFGVAAAGVLVGSAAGTYAWVKTRQIEDDCTTPNCDGDWDAARERERNDLLPFATTANIAFAVAGAGAVAGATLLLLDGPDSDRSSPRDTALRLESRGTSLVLSGSF